MTDEKVIWLDRDHLVDAVLRDEPEVHGTGGFSTAPSPYDVPEAVRRYSLSGGEVMIELKYIAPDEPYRFVEIDDVQVKAGKNSGRIYGFRCGFDAEHPQTLVDKVHRAVAKFIEKSDCPRKGNYRLVDMVVELELPQVLKDQDAEGPLSNFDLQRAAGGRNSAFF